MSVALQIRDVPEEVRDALAEQAKRSGTSLQGLLLRLVTREAVHLRNLAILDGLQLPEGGLASPESIVEVIDRSRAERDEELSSRMA